MGFQTTKEGEFWRILLPGIYTMEVFAEGFQPREVQFAVIEQNPTLLNITLYGDNTNRVDLQVQPSNIDEEEQPLEEEEEEEQGSTIFGLPNPLKSFQNSMRSILNKIPVIG